MRLSVAIAVACLATIGLSVAGESQASTRKHTEIPAQDLAPALQTLARDRDFQIVYVSEEIGTKHTDGALGEFTPEEALEQLLKGTGLTYRHLDERTITINPAGLASSGAKSDAAAGVRGAEARGDGPSDSKEGAAPQAPVEGFGWFEWIRKKLLPRPPPPQQQTAPHRLPN